MDCVRDLGHGSPAAAGCTGADRTECGTDIAWWTDPVKESIEERSGYGTSDGINYYQ